jgi:hypothetical protein
VKVSIPLGARIIVEQFPRTKEEIYGMAHVPYANFVGILMYVMVCTRPCISHAVGVLSRYILTPSKEHWRIVKIVFRCLCGIKYYAICYQGKLGGDIELNVHGFVDTDWAADLDRWSSTSGYVFKIFGGAIVWMSK